MTGRELAAVLVSVAGFAASAAGQAQVDATVTYSLSYVECDATAPFRPLASPNGVLEPGEALRLHFNASMSPTPGTPITFSPTLLAGSSGAGVVGGFAWGDLNLTELEGSQGMWVVHNIGGPPGNQNRLGLIPPFAAAYPGGDGSVMPGGIGVSDIQPAQFSSSWMSLNSASPTSTMWRGLWIPASYEPRTVSFALSNGSLGLGSSIWIRDANGMELPVYAVANSAYGSGVTVPVIPAPGAWAVTVGLACGCVRRRRGRLA